jgi:hypothetical protein
MCPVEACWLAALLAAAVIGATLPATGAKLAGQIYRCRAGMRQRCAGRAVGDDRLDCRRGEQFGALLAFVGLEALIVLFTAIVLQLKSRGAESRP